MNTFTIFAIDYNGNHFAEEYICQTNENAMEQFAEEYNDAKALFLVEGSPIYVQL